MEKAGEKIGLFTASYIDIYMAQAAKYSATTGADNTFKITFTRATYTELLNNTKTDETIFYIFLGCLGVCILMGVAWGFKRKHDVSEKIRKNREA